MSNEAMRDLGMCHAGRLLSREVAMTEASTALVEFLLARIEEDKRIAWLVASESPTTDTGFCVWATQFAFDPERMIVAIDYQRVLAECTAKRRIIDAFRAATPSTTTAETLEAVLRELASAHADHHDYQEDWRI
ncbi:MAG: hypothetical protein JST25_05300 [Actinobacteria bacterium]|nr:hypothetical protein [Actinomycetota bacterium]